MSPVILAFALGITRCVLFNALETTSHLLPPGDPTSSSQVWVLEGLHFH